MSDRDFVDFLTTVPLLEGIEEADLVELERVMRLRTFREGELLWREGEEAKGMALIVSGHVAVLKRLPGDRTVEVAQAAAGETLGEIPLVDGGPHSATVRATCATTVLSLSRSDFEALVSRLHPAAFALKRRIAEVITARLRRQLGSLVTSLGPEATREPEAEGAQPYAQLEFCAPPDSKYLRRMATFRAFDSLALWGFLTAGRYARCLRGHTLIAEGAPSTACCVTINGAVEKLLIRGNQRIRIELAGPGQAFGYEGLIDGNSSPLTAITRERALLLVLPAKSFEHLFHGETDISHVFLDVINRSLTASLRQALRPQARLAMSVARSDETQLTS